MGVKEISFSVVAVEVAVYNQLARSVESNERAGYLKIKNCGSFELLQGIPNCKVLELIDAVMSAKNLKTAAGQWNIYIRPIQRSSSVIHLKSGASSFSLTVLKDDVREEDSASPDVELFVSNGNNSESD